MSERLRNFEKIMLVALFTTFMGQIYITPFGTSFRLTFAVVVLNILMLTFTEIKAFYTINLVGILMFLVRSSMYTVSSGSTLFQSFYSYYPILFFYFFYSVFFIVLGVRGLIKTPVSLFLAIWICDSIPNLIELIVRMEWRSVNLEDAVFTIIFIGLVRTFFTTILIYLSRAYYRRVKERDVYQQFVNKMIMMSNLKTELFFLKKSKNDIEAAMQESYKIYEQIVDAPLKIDVLNLATDIHEIKKDYTRVISGIEKNIDDTPIYLMAFKKLLSLVVDANDKNAKAQGKTVLMNIWCNDDFKTAEYYGLISILNNLIANSIDAIEKQGVLSIYGNRENSFYRIVVEDNGTGIDISDLSLIFAPGFSTKFNQTNGIMASGIGLTHVKHLVETYFHGSIEVESHVGLGTKIEVLLPIAVLTAEHEAMDKGGNS